MATEFNLVLDGVIFTLAAGSAMVIAMLLKGLQDKNRSKVKTRLFLQFDEFQKTLIGILLAFLMMIISTALSINSTLFGTDFSFESRILNLLFFVFLLYSIVVFHEIIVWEKGRKK